MERSSTSSSQEAQQERSLFLFVVVVGYIITLTRASIGETGCSILQLIIGIFFGFVYLSLGFFGAEILRRFSDRRNVLIFSPNWRCIASSAKGLANVYQHTNGTVKGRAASTMSQER